MPLFLKNKLTKVVSEPSHYSMIASHRISLEIRCNQQRLTDDVTAKLGRKDGSPNQPMRCRPPEFGVASAVFHAARHTAGSLTTAEGSRGERTMVLGWPERPLGKPVAW